MSVYPIDQYQNAIPRAMRLHELNSQDSIGHMKNPLHERFIAEQWSLNGNDAAYRSALKKKKRKKA